MGGGHLATIPVCRNGPGARQPEWHTHGHQEALGGFPAHCTALRPWAGPALHMRKVRVCRDRRGGGVSRQRGCGGRERFDGKRYKYQGRSQIIPQPLSCRQPGQATVLHNESPVGPSTPTASIIHSMSAAISKPPHGARWHGGTVARWHGAPQKHLGHTCGPGTCSTHTTHTPRPSNAVATHSSAQQTQRQRGASRGDSVGRLQVHHPPR
jgi:hypothetical protein